MRGPVGSTKTTACIVDLIRRAKLMPQMPDGIRRSRTAIVRNTFPQLRSTCLASIQQHFRHIAHYKPSISTVQVRFEDVEADWLLLPLDTPQNIQRLLSLELTNAWISEFREIDPEVVEAILSRTGRYPSFRTIGHYHYGAIMETNSFSQDSPWYEPLEEALPATWSYTVQPGARDEAADWLEYLPPNYYDDLVASNSPEWVEQYVDNKVTPSLSGQAVYRNSYNKDFHEHTGLLPIRGTPLCVGMDFARHPAAVFLQMQPRGVVAVLGEAEQENTGIEKFIAECLMPELQKERYSGLPVYVVGDPSGMARGQVGEEHVFDILKKRGFMAMPAQTNAIDPRIRAVEQWLIQQRDGKAAIRFDRDHCPLLCKAMRSEYRFKKKNTGELDAAPEKRRPWTDLAEALQYGCLGLGSSILGRVMAQMRPQKYREPSAMGWT